MSIYSSTKSMRIDVQQILMKPPIVYMNEGHSFCVFLFNYESNKLFNDFLLLDLVIFCNIIFELNFRNYTSENFNAEIWYQTFFWVKNQDTTWFPFKRTYSYLKKIKLFLDMYLCSSGKVLLICPLFSSCSWNFASQRLLGKI